MPNPTSVWKYDLSFNEVVTLEMPEGATLLHADVQFDIPRLWVRVHPKAPLTMRRVRIAGTGHLVESGKYVGSFVMSGGHLVFHVFDLGEEG